MKKPKVTVTYGTVAYVKCENEMLFEDLQATFNRGSFGGSVEVLTTVEELSEKTEDDDSQDINSKLKEYLKAVLKEVSGKAGDVIFHR